MRAVSLLHRTSGGSGAQFLRPHCTGRRASAAGKDADGPGQQRGAVTQPRVPNPFYLPLPLLSFIRRVWLRSCSISPSLPPSPSSVQWTVSCLTRVRRTLCRRFATQRQSQGRERRRGEQTPESGSCARFGAQNRDAMQFSRCADSSEMTTPAAIPPGYSVVVFWCDILDPASEPATPYRPYYSAVMPRTCCNWGQR
jgi:hypothetical protein